MLLLLLLFDGLSFFWSMFPSIRLFLFFTLVQRFPCVPSSIVCIITVKCAVCHVQRPDIIISLSVTSTRGHTFFFSVTGGESTRRTSLTNYLSVSLYGNDIAWYPSKTIQMVFGIAPLSSRTKPNATRQNDHVSSLLCIRCKNNCRVFME